MARRNTKVAQRYSDALFQVLENKDQWEAALKELRHFQQLMETHKEIDRFFLSPVVGEAAKREAVDSIKDKFPLTQRFLLTLVDAGRMEVMAEICNEFEQLKEEACKELSVNLTTAHAIHGDELEEIGDYLSTRWPFKLKFKMQVDPEILGGFVARAKGRLLDASAVSQLESLEHRVLG